MKTKTTWKTYGRCYWVWSTVQKTYRWWWTGLKKEYKTRSWRTYLNLVKRLAGGSSGYSPGRKAAPTWRKSRSWSRPSLRTTAATMWCILGASVRQLLMMRHLRRSCGISTFKGRPGCRIINKNGLCQGGIKEAKRIFWSLIWMNFLTRCGWFLRSVQWKWDNISIHFCSLTFMELSKGVWRSWTICWKVWMRSKWLWKEIWRTRSTTLTKE